MPLAGEVPGVGVCCEVSVWLGTEMMTCAQGVIQGADPA